MADEAFGWLFVNDVPLLYDKKRVARQFQVENWLDLTQVLKELGVEKGGSQKVASQLVYIV
ncbi:MAG: hypothetical protein QXJ02_02020 [Candidatus Bathyarchaeia archaeon]